jgi:2,3-diketo-5-methylthio-1-phosphopentane phosphatase
VVGACCRCDLKVVSDANAFFIETVLEHHGVLGCFSEINTTPARVDADGRLRISPFHDPTSSPHGCSLCPENMCKVWTVGCQISSRVNLQIQLLYSMHVTDGDKRGCDQ